MSKRQNCVSKSTGEAELVAINDAMQKIGINAHMIAQAIFGNEIRMKVFSDSDAAIGAIKDGWGKMRYVKKTQRVSVGWLNDIFQESELELAKIDGTKNIGDMLTKELERVKHQESVGKMHVERIPDENRTGQDA